MSTIALSTLDPPGYRSAIGTFATGVAVITACDGGDEFGVTVNSLTSVSLEPLMLLVSLKRQSVSAAAILRSRRFGVSILGADQEAVSRRFVAPVADRFAGVACDRSQGLPLIAGAVAAFVCDLERGVDAGDHTLVLGTVRLGGARAAEPLVYHRGSYARILHAV
ncbi:MAG: flavin reductase family protein [Pseudomonadota bacterium]